MVQRFNIAALAPDLYEAVTALDRALTASGIDADLLHLLKLRASQINGCSLCVDLHVKEALADGMDSQRLQQVSAWYESPAFDDRERALLSWTESVTLLAESHAPDDVYAEMKRHFAADMIARITVALGVINLFNRLAVPSRMRPAQH